MAWNLTGRDGHRGWGQTLIVAGLLWAALLPGAAPARADAGDGSTSTTALNKLADQFYRANERRIYRPRLDDKGNAAWLRSLGRMEQRLDKIPATGLGQQARITRRLLKSELTSKRQHVTGGWIKEDLNGTDSQLHTLTFPLDRPRKTAGDWRWLVRTIKHATPFVDGYIGQLRQGMREGRTRNRGAVKSSIECLSTLTSASAKVNPYLALEAEMSKQLAGHKQLPALRRELRQAVQQNLLPSSRKLRRFLQQRYLPKASKLGQDRGRYLHHMAEHLGPGHPSPEKLGRWGRQEVKRLLKELQQTARQIDPKARSLGGFMRKFNASKDNHYRSGDALLSHARVELKEAKRQARQLAPIPRSKITLGRVPGYAEGTTTAQYLTDPKRKLPTGEMQVNTGKLLGDQLRSGMATLITHEVFGGHHLSYVYAKKQKRLPKFRREANNTAYDEGWALYAEQWRNDHKGFAPQQRVGYLTDQLWRAARLVVDTGLHTGAMTPKQAERYFRSSTFTGKAAAKAEIQRYVDWPGQALSYYYGKDHLLKTRGQVKRILGQRGFDARKFHAKLLSLGPVPLQEARRSMVSWAQRRKAQIKGRGRRVRLRR